MNILNQWDISLSVDEVLNAQGSNPEVIRKRRPSLVETTKEAIRIGRSLIKPQVIYEKYPVYKFIHQRLELSTDISFTGNAYLSGPLIAQHLAQCHEIIALVCTLGNEIDDMVSSIFKVNPLFALAIDGYGSAAVERLSLLACNHLEIMANKAGLNTTMPLNPGMIGWPIEIGQPQIFVLLETEKINVTITDTFMMIPNKSLSMVLGIGKDISDNGSTCEYCSLAGVCRYQDHYA